MNEASHKGVRMLAAGLLVAAIVAAIPSARAQSPNREGMDAIAAAVRVHGYACEQPKSAARDAEQSSPDEVAWIITCESGRYRVKFTGDTGSRVEPLQ
jgi:hypothetical protein